MNTCALTLCIRPVLLLAQVFFATESRFRDEWSGDVGHGYDIALLKLNKRANFPTPRLTTVRERPVMGTFVSVIGWGETSSGPTLTRLQYSGSLRVVRFATCNDHWNKTLKEDITLCAGIGVIDTCKGVCSYGAHVKGQGSRQVTLVAP